MEGVVEGQRREGEKGQKKGRGRREGINGGGGGVAKEKRKVGGAKTRKRKEGGH